MRIWILKVIEVIWQYYKLAKVSYTKINYICDVTLGMKY